MDEPNGNASRMEDWLNLINLCIEQKEQVGENGFYGE